MSLDALFARRTLGVRPGLVALRQVFAALGSPCSETPAIHVVGTNGKGSIAAMAEHALRRRGERTGLFTSPHLQRVTERIRIDGAEVEEEVLEAAIAWVLALESDALPRPLSFFEVLTLAALVVFEQSGCSSVVAEAGLGGRLDTTRLVYARAVAFARVDLDHQMYLGDTLVQIAAEKAAVFAPGAPVFSVPQHPDVQTVLQEQGRATPCAVRYSDPVGSPLGGDHQRFNAGVAVDAARMLCPEVEPGDVFGTRWPGRFERRPVKGGGEWILDVAHNPASVEALARQLAELPPLPTLVVTGRSSDKDGARMRRALGSPARCWSVQDSELGLESLPLTTVFEGLDATGLEQGVRAHLEDGGRVVVCGSHRLIGAVMTRWLHDGPPGPLDPSDPR